MNRKYTTTILLEKMEERKWRYNQRKRGMHSITAQDSLFRKSCQKFMQ